MLVCSLLTSAFAQDKKCPCGFNDTFVLQGVSFETDFSSSVYISISGPSVLAINCTDENPAKHMMMENRTVYATHGDTGELILFGWDWTLFNITGTYTMSSINGNLQTCQKHETIPIPRYSQMVSNLFQIVPFGNESIGDTVICQGYDKGPGPSTIVTMSFQKDGEKMNLLETNFLNEGTEVTTYPKTLRPLDPTKDADLFKPCENAVETNKKVKLQQTLYEKIKDFVSTQN